VEFDAQPATTAKQSKLAQIKIRFKIVPQACHLSFISLLGKGIRSRRHRKSHCFRCRAFPIKAHESVGPLCPATPFYEPPVR